MSTILIMIFRDAKPGSTLIRVVSTVELGTSKARKTKNVQEYDGFFKAYSLAYLLT
jgi:hypothetical protein